MDDITHAHNGTILTEVLGNNTTDLAQNVQALQFQYGLHSENQVLLNQRPEVRASWDTCQLHQIGNMQINVVGNVSRQRTCNITSVLPVVMSGFHLMSVVRMVSRRLSAK